MRNLKVAGALLVLCFGRYIISQLFSSGSRKIGGSFFITRGSISFFTCPDGNTYCIETEGDVRLPVIVFIHGLNSDSRQWHYQRLFFRGKYRLVFIDLPGHGRSLAAHDLSISTLAKDLRMLLIALDLTDAVLYGHSMGGNIVLEYCGQHAFKPHVKGIIVHQSSYTNPLKTCLGASVLYPSGTWLLVPLLHLMKSCPSLFWFISRINYMTGLSGLFFRFLFFAGRQSPSELLFMSSIAVACSPRSMAEGLLSLMKFESQHYLKNIMVPALILGGKKDRLVRYKANIFMQGQMNNATLRLIDSGHLDLVEEPDLVNETLDAFISALQDD